jgi:leucyl-tRNA synthetase
VINPDDIIDTFGADSLRIYEMFMGPFGQAIAWSTDNLVGARRFVERIWKLSQTGTWSSESGGSLDTLYHQSVKKVSDDIEDFKFNTAISQLMILLNAMEKEKEIPREYFLGFLKILAPFAPYVSEEIWEALGEKTSIHREAWPMFDPKKIISENITIGIQVNGKLRGDMEIARTEGAEEVKKIALAKPEIQKWTEGKEPKKIIYVEGKIVNIVV